MLGFYKNRTNNSYFLVDHDKHIFVNVLTLPRWENSREALLRDFKIIKRSRLAIGNVIKFLISGLYLLLNKMHQMFFKPVIGEYTYRHLN